MSASGGSDPGGDAPNAWGASPDKLYMHTTER
jgi:hypothetical protein